MMDNDKNTKISAKTEFPDHDNMEDAYDGLNNKKLGMKPIIITKNPKSPSILIIGNLSNKTLMKDFHHMAVL